MINDHLFLQLLNCPLKGRYVLEEKQGMGKRPVYRQRNKLHLRDAVATRFKNVRATADEVVGAEEETRKWLKEREVSICGAVIRSGELLTRMPILLKEGKKLTIVQIHGKLRKRTVSEIQPGSKQERDLTDYMIRAAYRSGVLMREYPDHSINVEFYFPDKSYISSKKGLYKYRSELSESAGGRIEEEFQKLFMKIDVTQSVADMVLNGVPYGFAQQGYCEISFQKLLEKIESLSFEELEAPVNPIAHCRQCEFRKSGSDISGCWELNFADQSIHYPDKHVYELIGHGNRRESENGELFREQVQIHDGLHSFELMKKYGGPKISIQQRRNLQILSARGENVPTVWLKKEAEMLKDIQYPLHFIDFEAATYALPNRKGVSPYSPVYFQYSCHTLKSSELLEHTGWLDEDPDEINPGVAFTKKLAEIPQIFEGTVIHYSPFERQAIQNLLKQFRTGSEIRTEEIDILNSFLVRQKDQANERFLDLSKVIRDSYFNRFMEGGLGLKQVLSGVLMCEKFLRSVKDDNECSLPMKNGYFFGTENPYLDIQLQNSSISDGSAAMNAWISLKCGLLSDDEQLIVPSVLKEYCRLDSLSMVVIFNHIKQLLNEFSEDELGDIILF